MKMRKLLLGVFLGLLAVVHSTPVNTVTHVPVENEDVLREAMTDGFLVPSLTTETPETQSTTEAWQQTSTESSPTAPDASRDSVLPSVTTESPETNTSVQASPQPDSAESEEAEGSAAGVTDNFWFGGDTTTTSMQETEASSPTESMTSGFDPTELPAESTTVKASQLPFSEYMTEGSASGESEDSPTSTLYPDHRSVDEEVILPDTIHSLDSEMIKEPPQSTKKEGRLIQKETSARINSPNPDPEQHKGHSTPGWIIIVGFIVGVAALVMLCLAIATRDKWNGPSQASKTKTESNPSNQQRELEMETFLHSEEPKENGKAAEYTVIPLDELSESYS